VYLPPGSWIDYQSGKVFRGGQWQEIKAGEIPVVLLVKDHTVLPLLKVAQSTQDLDWSNVELRVFSTDSGPASGLFTSPNTGVETLQLSSGSGGYALNSDPARGKVTWQIRRFETK